MSLEARKIRLIMDLRKAGISDTGVLSAIERIPREAFVLPMFQDQAYENRALPIAQGQTLSQPQVVAVMTQALAVERRSKVLEVGTGSGYQAAILSRLCRRLYTVERLVKLLRTAEERFAALRLHNIITHVGDGAAGWPAQAPFDRIIVTAAAARVPAALADQLAVDGIMVIPVGQHAREQELLRMTRRESGFEEQSLGMVRFVPLIAAEDLPDRRRGPAGKSGGREASGPDGATLA